MLSLGERIDAISLLRLSHVNLELWRDPGQFESETYRFARGPRRQEDEDHEAVSIQIPIDLAWLPRMRMFPLYQSHQT